MCPENPTHACAVCPSRLTTEWQVLTSTELAMLDQSKRSRVLEPGATLFRQGDDPEGVYCIKSGLIGLRRITARGDSALLRLCAAGTTLGYRATLSKSPHRNSAEVLTPSVVCFIERSSVSRLLAANPQLGEHFLQHAFKELDESEGDHAKSLTLNMKARFLHVLLVLYERVGYRDEDQTCVVELPIQRNELASLIGAEPASVSRLIRHVQDEGLMQFEKRRVRISNMDAVLREAGVEL